MLTAVSFLITKNQKQLKCPSTGKWVNKLSYIHVSEYFSVIKRNTLLTPTTWMKCKIIMLQQRRKRKKRIFPVTIPIIGNSRKCKLIYSNREQISSYLGKEGEKEEWISKKNKETFEGDEWIHYLNCGDMYYQIIYI